MTGAPRENLPNSWKLADLCEVAELNPRLDKSAHTGNPMVSFVPMPRIEAGTGAIDVSQTRNLEEVKKGYTPFREGDVLFAKITPCMENGKMAVVPPLKNDLGFGSTEFHVLRPYCEISAQYIYFFVSSESFRRDAGHNMTGAVGQRRVPTPYLADQSIPVPPAREQRRIVAKIEELFSELDKGIESLKTARAQLNVYRQAVLKYAFEGKLTAQWREENKDKLETAEQLIERVPVCDQPRGGRAASTEGIEGVAAMAVNIPSKAPPQGWSWVSLLRIARQETGHTPSRRHPEYWDGDQGWIGIADARLHHGKEIQDTIQKVTRKGLENSSARTLPARTVCLSRTASIGYVCIMAKPMATSQDFATWTCTEALEPKFLMYALMAEGNEITRFGKGTTHTTIYFPEIRAMTICLPPLEEQNAIIDAVEAKLQQLDALAAGIDSSLARCDVFRQSILKKAFSGQLVAQDPNDEPASVLLDRIRAEREKAAKNNHSKKTKKRKTTA